MIEANLNGTVANINIVPNGNYTISSEGELNLCNDTGFFFLIKGKQLDGKVIEQWAYGNEATVRTAFKQQVNILTNSDSIIEVTVLPPRFALINYKNAVYVIEQTETFEDAHGELQDAVTLLGGYYLSREEAEIAAMDYWEGLSEHPTSHFQLRVRGIRPAGAPVSPTPKDEAPTTSTTWNVVFTLKNDEEVQGKLINSADRYYLELPAGLSDPLPYYCGDDEDALFWGVGINFDSGAVLFVRYGVDYHNNAEDNFGLAARDHSVDVQFPPKPIELVYV